ncbi:unnamed protein product, partial [Symbiodinium microadriaticum]
MTRAYHVCKKCSSWIFQDRVGANPFCQKCGCQWPKQQTPKHSAVSGAEWANRGDPNRVWKNKGPKRAGNAPVGAAQRALVSVWDALPGPAKQAIEQAGWQPRPLESPPGLGGKGNQSAAEVCRAPKGGAGKGRGAVKAAESGNDEGHAEAVKSLFASASEEQRGLLTQLGLQEPAEAPPDLAALCKQHINSLPPDIRKLVDETPEKPQTAQELMSEKSKKFKLATADLRDLIFKKSALQLRLNKHKELYTAMLEDMKSINEKLEDKQKAVSSLQIELQASVDVAQVPEALPEATEVLAKQIEAMEVEQLDECRQRLFEVVDEAVKRRRTEPPASTNPQPSPNPAGRGAGQHAAEDTGENRQADEPVALSGDVRGTASVQPIALDLHLGFRATSDHSVACGTVSQGIGWMGGIFFKVPLSCGQSHVLGLDPHPEVQVEQVQVRACTYDQLPRHAPGAPKTSEEEVMISAVLAGVSAPLLDIVEKMEQCGAIEEGTFGWKVAALRLKDVDCYLVNVYLKSGEGFQGSHNAPILANLIAFLRSVKGLYFVAGDFNEDFEVIAATTLEQEAKGRWISSGESTCAGGGNIDFGLLEMITVRPFLDAPVQERIYLRWRQWYDLWSHPAGVDLDLLSSLKSLAIEQ